MIIINSSDDDRVAKIYHTHKTSWCSMESVLWCKLHTTTHATGPCVRAYVRSMCVLHAACVTYTPRVCKWCIAEV